MNETDIMLTHLDAFMAHTQRQIDWLQEELKRKEAYLAGLTEQRAEVLTR